MIITEPGVPKDLLPDSARLPCRSLSDILGLNWPGSKTRVKFVQGSKLLQSHCVFTSEKLVPKVMVFGNWSSSCKISEVKEKEKVHSSTSFTEASYCPDDDVFKSKQTQSQVIDDQ